MTKTRAGFTLAELLISLALLGLIAAFTIPRILNATGSAQNIAKVKDALSTLEQAWYSVKMQNQICVANGCTANGDTSGNTEFYDQVVGNPGNSAGPNFLATGTTGAAAPNSATPPANVEAGVGGCNSATNPAGATFQGYLLFPNGILVSGLSTAAGSSPINDFGPVGNAASTSDFNLLLCIDTSPASQTHTAGTNLFFANFNPTGDFAGNQTAQGLTTVPNTNNKNFYYGASGLLFAAGAPGTAPPAGITAVTAAYNALSQ